MKLYVIPVERECNGRCPWCITKFRKMPGQEYLDLCDLDDLLSRQSFDRIEITGGGEPTLHPNIGEIIEMCAKHAPTQMYTNGGTLWQHLRSPGPFHKLARICLSRAHYDDNKNEEIMGVRNGIGGEIYTGISLKLSLLLCKSGIRDAKELRKYIEWAQGKRQVKKIVIRELFDGAYPDKIRKERVYSEEICEELGLPKDYPYKKFGNLIVERETNSCACKNNDPILHADGIVRKTWGI